MLDATALFGHVCQELSFKRKETIKPILHPDFKSFCSCNHKVGKLLFGEDLPKVVQDLRASTKGVTQLTSSVASDNKAGKNKSFYNHLPNNKNFLSQGRNQYPPRKTSYQNNKKTYTKK